MALQFQPYQGDPGIETRNRFSRSLDSIFEAYRNAKTAAQQDQLQGILLREKFGVDPRQLSPEQLNTAFTGPSVYQNQGPVPPGQAPLGVSTTFDQNPIVAAIQSYVQKNRDAAKLGAASKQADIEKTMSETGLNRARTLETLGGKKEKQTPPPGFRFTLSGDLEPIPGGPAAMKISGEKQREARGAADIQEKASRMIQNINDLIPRVSNVSAGTAAITSFIPGTPASNLSADMKTLQANIAFQALNDMRAASKTGGALGAISEKELELLESTIASLKTSQSPDQLTRNLEKVRDSFARVLDVARNESATQQGAIGLTGEKAARLAELRAKAGGGGK